MLAAEYCSPTELLLATFTYVSCTEFHCLELVSLLVLASPPGGQSLDKAAQLRPLTRQQHFLTMGLAETV